MIAKRVMLTVVLVTVFVLGGSTQIVKNMEPVCDWPCYRGNPQRTGASECGPKSSELEIAWTHDNGEWGYNDPSVSGGRVITPYKYGEERGLVCLDAKNGSEIWKKQFTGKGDIETPLIVGDKLYCSVYDKFVCMNATNGDLLWEYGDSFCMPPLYLNGSVFGCSSSKDLCSIDAQNGTLNWSKSLDGGCCVSAPSTFNDLIYISDGLGMLHCLGIEKGNTIWTKKFGELGLTTPAFYDGKLFVCGATDLYCLDPATGNQTWNVVTDTDIFDPAFSDGKMVFSCYDGHLHCLEAKSGKELWINDTITKYPITIEEFIPTISNGMIFIGTTARDLTIVDLASGKELKRIRIDSGAANEVVVACDNLYVNTYSKTICLRQKPVITSIAIEKPDHTLKVGERYQFRAKAYDEDSEEIVNPYLTWSVEPEDAGIMSRDGFFLCRKPGTCKIIVTSQDKVASIEITIDKGVDIGLLSDSGCDWQMDRGDLQRTGSSNGGPKKAKLGLLWKKDKHRIFTICSGRILGDGPGPGLICFDEDLNIIWKYITEKGVVDAGVIDKRVIFSSPGEGVIYCCDFETGSLIWKVNKIVWEFNISSDKVFLKVSPSIFSDRYTIECLNPSDGKTLWTSREYRDGYYLAYSNKKIYLSSLYSIICLDSSDGSQSWEYKTDTVIEGSPVVSDGKVYCTNQKGHVYCLDAGSGKKIWYASFEEDNDGVVNIISCSPAIYENKLYCCAQYGSVFCFDAKTGATLWEFEADNKLEYMNPVASNGMVYFGSYSYLYCVSANEGKLLWQYRLDNAIGTLIPALGKLYLWVHDKDVLLCFGEKQVTETKLSFTLGSSIYDVNGQKMSMDAEPVNIGGRIFLPARYAVEPLGGTISYDSSKKMVVISFGTIEIQMIIGSNMAKINGSNVKIDLENPDIVPVIQNGRTMLPLRFIGESLGCSVTWDDATKTAMLIKAS